MKHDEITGHFIQFTESFYQIEEENFDLNTTEISESIYRHIFLIKSALWKQGVKFNRRKRISISEIFQDLVALYIKLGINNNEFEIILEETKGRLQPDILIKFNKKNLFIIEVKTNLGWKRNYIETKLGNRIRKLSETFDVPFENVIYIFQNPWNMPKSFTLKYWDQVTKCSQEIPLEFPYNRIRPLLTAEDPFYSKAAKSMDRSLNFEDMSNAVDHKVKEGIVIPLEKTILDILSAARKDGN